MIGDVSTYIGNKTKAYKWMWLFVAQTSKKFSQHGQLSETVHFGCH